jgi:hypothetical protein
VATRRSLILAAGATVAVGVLPHARAQRLQPLVRVYKSPSCGCCGEWEKHMRAFGFRVESHGVEDVTALKRSFGVPQALWSCHTAIVEGYVLEGHVPASDVTRLLRERAKVRGLAVPGMPVGSAGMEQGRPEPYSTIAFDERSTRVFERH